MKRLNELPPRYDEPVTLHGVTYYPKRSQAVAAAVTNNLPTDRIIEYGLGYAIQLRVSGPYHCDKTARSLAR